MENKVPTANLPVVPANAKKTAIGTVFVYNKKTGAKLERWPVDARELTARCADWTFDPLPEKPAPVLAIDKAVEEEIEALSSAPVVTAGKMKSRA